MTASHEQKIDRMTFYRKYYHKILFALIGLLFLSIIIVSMVLYQVLHRPLPNFNAMTNAGQTMVLEPSEIPNLLPATLLRWASKAAVAAYTFDFVNYQKQASYVRSYFTDSGWSDYQGSISGLIASIRQRQLFVNGVVSGPPIIASQGNYFGRGYVWHVQIPFLVTYQSSEETSQSRYLVLMTIVRVSTLINPTGIGIDQFVMV